MRIPGMTREGKLEAPIEPGARDASIHAFHRCPEMMALDHARKAPAFRNADHVDLFVDLEVADQNLIPAFMSPSPPESRTPAGTSRLPRRPF